ncbi:distal tail protein Dit [Macrococcus capreoli]|uniref:distal tail protein Dit n=1 Tax=Macrococcus capreoli TaxID=2982690 RepID=UPI003F41BFBC
MINSITLDGYDILEDGLFIDNDELDSPISSGYKRNVITLPGRPGAIYYKDEINPIQFDFKLSYIGNDQLDLQQAIRKLKKRLIDNDGKPKLIKLICSWEPDIYYNVMLTDKEFDNKSTWQRISDYTLSFICYDGFGLLIQEDTLLWGDTQVPHGSFNYEMGDVGTMDSKTLTSNGSISIDNKQFTTYPIITITGTTVGINIQLNGVSTTIGALNNQTLVIDCKEKSVLLNGVYDLSKVNDLNWLDLKLNPGTNNIWFYSGSMNVSVTVDFEERIY